MIQNDVHSQSVIKAAVRNRPEGGGANARRKCGAAKMCAAQSVGGCELDASRAKRQEDRCARNFGESSTRVNGGGAERNEGSLPRKEVPGGDSQDHTRLLG